MLTAEFDTHINHGGEEPMKRVFLDIDGVLAPQSRLNPHVWCHSTVMRLKRLVDETGAKVVLASSWPEDAAYEQLAAHEIELHDTIEHEYRTSGARHHVNGYRGREGGIIEYLATHPEITRWVWLDDWGKLRGKVLNPEARLKDLKYAPHPLDVGYIECDWLFHPWSKDKETDGHGFDEHCFARAKAILSG